MSTTRFKNDPVPQKGIRFFLFLQIGAVVTVLGLSLLDLFSPALAISFLMFMVLIAILHWLYLRYQSIPMVQKKQELQREVLRLQHKIRAETLVIQTSKKRREELFGAEKKEISSSLNHLQQNHLQNYQPLHEQNITAAMDAEARSILWKIRITHGLGIRKRT